MGVTRQPFNKEELCKVVGPTVSLKGMRTSLDGKSSVMKKTCSNVVDCIETYGSTDRIPMCLLHSFS